MHGIRQFAEFVRHTPLHPQWLLPRREFVLDFVQPVEGSTVVDVGCGDRWMEKKLPATCRYIGIDYPATGAQLYHAFPDCFADAAALPLPDQSIDCILLFDVVEHLADPIKALSEVGRVLKPAGVVMVSVPFIYPVHDAPHDYQRFTSYGLVMALERAGLEIRVVKPYLRAAETAGLLLSLWLAATTIEAWRKRHWSLVLTPFFLLLIPASNVLFWLVARSLPNWQAMFGGVFVSAGKRGNP